MNGAPCGTWVASTHHMGQRIAAEPPLWEDLAGMYIQGRPLAAQPPGQEEGQPSQGAVPGGDSLLGLVPCSALVDTVSGHANTYQVQRWRQGLCALSHAPSHQPPDCGREQARLQRAQRG